MRPAIEAGDYVVLRSFKHSWVYRVTRVSEERVEVFAQGTRSASVTTVERVVPSFAGPVRGLHASR